MEGNLFISNSDILKVIKHFLLLLLILFLFDRAIGVILKQQFSKITYGTYGKINTSLNTNAEILIFGSSRAENHYNPEIISEQTRMTCRNTGLGGQSIFYYYTLLASILNRFTPKLIILDISPNVIVDFESYTKLNLFNPYYNWNNYFDEILELSPNYESFKFLLFTYRYNSTIFDIIRSDIFSFNQMHNGYQPLYGQLNRKTFTPFYLKDYEKFDSVSKIYFNKFIDLVLKHKIKLLCTISPTYEKFDKNNRITNQVKNILLKYKLKLYDFSDSPLFYNSPQYFYNQLHLNEKGSDIYTLQIIKLIKTKL